MQSFEEIEIQLWDYIGNRCSEAERARIATLIAHDAIWKKLYEDISATDELLHTTEPEHTSMRFTKNVMEAVAETTIAPRTGQYLNHSLLKGIAAVMAICIISLLAYVLIAADWSQTRPATSRTNIDLGWITHPLVLQVAGFIFMLLSLTFLDSLFRRKALTGRNTPS